MRYHTYFLPKLPNSTDPILDYEVTVSPLDWNERYYLPQETGNYSVAGFKLYMERKMTHYVITYYLPSGLFVVVSFTSFLIPSDDIQVHPNPAGLKSKSINDHYREEWPCLSLCFLSWSTSSMQSPTIHLKQMD